jgi:Tol biopolymer transport system component
MDGNGRFVAFSSLASDLVPGDTNNFEDIFVFDRQLHTTERVSVGAGGVQSNGGSFRVAISANGQFVAFDSAASNLVPGDTNNHLDIFVFDRQAQTTERVSVGANNTESNQDSSSPSISADARFIAFQSKATNLVAGDNSGLNQDIFLFNRESRATQNVSVRRYGGAVGDSSNPAISPDGTAVVFSSLHQGLVSNDTNNAEDVFLYTRTQSSPTLGPLSNSITLISRRPPGASTVPTNGPSFSPSVSNSTPFGRIVVFSSRATNIVGGDDNNTEDIFVAEFVGSLFRISRFTNGNQRSFTPSISADGQFIAFASDATNLVAGDTNGVTDIFIVPTFRSQTGQDLGYERISVNTNGDQATSPGEAPAIAGNGKSVAFRSAASTLALGDTNGKNDIFVREGLYIPPRIVTVPSGQRVAGIDFGDYFPFSLATISGTVFLDSNVNGTHDANEPVLAGETIFADSNNNGSLDLDEHTSTTLADGSYRIGLLPGTHLLRVLVPTGPVTAPAGGFHSITLSHAGEILADRDFGVSPAPGGTVVSGPGTVILNGRTVAFSGETSVGALQVLPGGKLAGTGTVIGQVTSAGRISPGQSPGILTIDGNYTQTTTGTLTIELGGLESGSEHDQLVVFGNASLDGTLEVALVDGFMPQAGDQFQILGYDQRVGNFAVISGLDLGNGLVLVPTYTAVGLTLVTQSNNPHPWQNPANALDVSDDTHVTSIDALLVINYLNAFGSGLLPTDGGLQPPFLDVNGDGNLDIVVGTQSSVNTGHIRYYSVDTTSPLLRVVVVVQAPSAIAHARTPIRAKALSRQRPPWACMLSNLCDRDN